MTERRTRKLVKFSIKYLMEKKIIFLVCGDICLFFSVGAMFGMLLSYFILDKAITHNFIVDFVFYLYN